MDKELLKYIDLAKEYSKININYEEEFINIESIIDLFKTMESKSHFNYYVYNFKIGSQEFGYEGIINTNKVNPEIMINNRIKNIYTRFFICYAIGYLTYNKTENDNYIPCTIDYDLIDNLVNSENNKKELGSLIFALQVLIPQELYVKENIKCLGNEEKIANKIGVPVEAIIARRKLDILLKNFEKDKSSVGHIKK